ncbi:MAG: endonuclease III [Oscillospiraceae bacterium]|nr:endonuclease III [Oscillospiraceae bacterium]
MRTKADAAKLVELLKGQYPLSQCGLSFENAWQLLVAVRLAAQCTDKRVNMITPILFEKYPTLQALAAAGEEAIAEIVKPCGFYHSKARDISLTANMLLEKYGGIVPDTMEELLKLPGVGRKSANLILGDIYGKPAVVADTHCIRLSNRLGFIDSKDPVKVETALRKVLPPEESNDFCHRLVLHGREVCTARTAHCDLCCLREMCPTAKKAAKAAAKTPR